MSPQIPNQNGNEKQNNNVGSPGTKDKPSQNQNQDQEQPQRYDEADPNWKNPDVQMQPSGFTPQMEVNDFTVAP